METIKKILEKIKRFFNKAWSIFLARATALTGLAVAALSAADWGPFMSAAAGVGFTKAQALSLGAVLIVQGLLQELARRQGTKTIATGQLIPANVEVKKVK